VREQGFICCYCEKRIGQQPFLTDRDIEHFMPRHPDSRLLSPKECMQCEAAQLDYANLFACCKGEGGESADHCNHKKDNWFCFASCISPADPRIRRLFGFGLDGTMFAVDPIGQKMASHLNLNSYVLQEQRKAAFDMVLDVEFCSMIVYCLREYLMDA